MNARVMATARSGSRGFLLPAKPLEVFPDPIIPGGRVIEAAYTSTGRGIVAWSGRNAVRAAFVDGRVVRAPRDLAPIAPDETRADLGLGDLAVSENGAAVVAMVAGRTRSSRRRWRTAAFGPTEVVGAGAYVHWPSAAYAERPAVARVAGPAHRRSAQPRGGVPARDVLTGRGGPLTLAPRV